ncbi:MAG TPA: hypothetical protein PK333_03845, partial [Candidatus Moranbacteria bacterium]|nr:hypothetical protein [Candidatus Moranbacteria bacterium]
MPVAMEKPTPSRTEFSVNESCKLKPSREKIYEKDTFKMNPNIIPTMPPRDVRIMASKRNWFLMSFSLAPTALR